MNRSNSTARTNIAIRGLIASAGLLVALLGATLSQQLLSSGSNSSIVALVDQRPISIVDADGLATELWALPYNKLSAEQRSSTVQLLIDQELLLARAEALGLTATDPGLRKVMAAAVIDQITNNFLQQAVTDIQLREFYQAYGSIFEQPKKIAVNALRLTDKSSIQQAQIMLAEGKNLTHISQSLQLDPVLPPTLLSIPMLHRYLGSSLVSHLEQLGQDEITPPLQRADGLYYLQVTAIEMAHTPSYQAIRQSIKAEYQRRGRHIALSNRLNQLWQQADIKTHKPFMASSVTSGVAANEGGQ